MATSPTANLSRDIQPDFAGLFQHVENYVRKHLAVANAEKDNKVPNFVKERLILASSRESVSELMSKIFSRACLIMKVIVSFMQECVFQTALYKAISPASESYIAALKDSIFPSKKPPKPL